MKKVRARVNQAQAKRKAKEDKGRLRGEQRKARVQDRGRAQDRAKVLGKAKARAAAEFPDHNPEPDQAATDLVKNRFPKRKPTWNSQTRERT